MRHITGKPDANKAALVAYWKSQGCDILTMHEDAAFDVLVFARNGLHVVEIKNPMTRWELTPAEETRRALCLALGIPYNIIEWQVQAQAMIGH